MAKKSCIGLVVFLVILLVAVTFGGIWVSSLFSAEKKVNELITEMKTKGKPTSIKDLKSTSKPDAQNAAVIYEEIFKQLGSDTGSSDSILAQFLFKRQDDLSLWGKAQETVDQYQKSIPMLEKAASKPECSFAYT